MAEAEPRTVFLVGAGPGDPRLITVAGVEALKSADVVLYDRLVSPALLKLAADAESVDVGKTPGGRSTSQDEIIRMMIDHARNGRRVVRLKGGDPFVFARGGEEASALAAAGIPMQNVPGVSSAYAAAAAVGIAVTDRRAASAVTVVTGSEGDGDAPAIDWDALASVGGTIVVMMGWLNFDQIAQRLIDAGLPPDSPAAAIEQAWTQKQRALFAPLNALRERAREMQAPVTVVIGETVRLATPEVSWSIMGKRVLVTRARTQAAPLVQRLQSLNAQVIELPAIEIKPSDPRPVDEAVGDLQRGQYDIAAFTSVNGVAQFWAALRRNGLDARAFSEVRVAAIGSETARALEQHGITADVVPESYTSAALATELTQYDVRGRCILLARAARGSEQLSQRLRAAGAQVDDVPLYRVVTPAPDEQSMLELERGVDVVTLTSPSTAQGLAELVGSRVGIHSLRAVCIGPVTAEAASTLGFRVVGVAETHTVEGLAQAVGRYLASLPPPVEESAETS